MTVDTDAIPPLVSASGELDAASSSDLARCIDQALSIGSGIVLDLGDVTFIDSSALRVVTLGIRKANDEDQTFTVSSASEAVRRIFEITGVSSILAS